MGPVAISSTLGTGPKTSWSREYVVYGLVHDDYYCLPNAVWQGLRRGKGGTLCCAVITWVEV